MIAPTLASSIGTALAEEGSGCLCDEDDQRWPVVDDIPFLRRGREDLAAAAVACLDRGDREGALVHLLSDQDDWWTGPKPDPDALRRLVRERHRLTLREAMDCLGFGRVGDYFAHRWSDPTYLAGLALLEAHWRPGTRTAFELACGIGHYGRELMRHGVAYTGGDVVFAKLWLARHWVLPPDARLICFDAAAPWPMAAERYDLVFCHDAFYFLEPKPAILYSLRSLRAPGGRLAISHIHNSGADNLSSGRAVSADDVARLFPDGAVYDDAELTRGLVEARAPRSAPVAALGAVEAFSVEDDARDGPVPRAILDGVSAPPQAAALRLNPLYRPVAEGVAIAWPSPRYEAEYAPRATYPSALSAVPAAGTTPDPDAVRRRILVDLPERW